MTGGSWLQISTTTPTPATWRMNLSWWGKCFPTTLRNRKGRRLIVFSLQVVEKFLLHFDNAYNIPNLRGHAAACRTNLPSNTAFRGFGVPQSLLVVENMVEDVAALLRRPAHQIREINMYKGPSVTQYKLEFSPENLRRCWEECKLKADHGARRRAADQFNRENRWRKRGMSIVPIKYGIAFSDGFLNQVCGITARLHPGSDCRTPPRVAEPLPR